MPLVVLCGQPCSGKTTQAGLIVEFLKQKKIPFRHITLDSLNLDRNQVFTNRHHEIRGRGKLKSAVERDLTQDCVVIVDTNNFIKSFRYELYCLVRTAHTRHCVVYCRTPDKVCKERNIKAREEDGAAEEKGGAGGKGGGVERKLARHGAVAGQDGGGSTLSKDRSGPDKETGAVGSARSGPDKETGAVGSARGDGGESGAGDEQQGAVVSEGQAEGGVQRGNKTDLQTPSQHQQGESKSRPGRYDWEVFRDLLGRFEEPEGSRRWDAPLFVVGAEEQVDPAAVWAALQRGHTVRANTATVPQKVQGGQFWSQLETALTQIVREIMQACSEGMLQDAIRVSHTERRVMLCQAVSLPRLRKARRQFVALIKLAIPETVEKAATQFVDFLNEQL